ncbi:unnamed protein product [Pleuronectes platessa]|uniref:Uncharacterized protein n=1 Tax=Pleuronectes platessa TaxID=8262 RepID=A0A9N7YQJ7_PLEPL|nr:unnamed protein product [Pleuronectes platessa]
MTAQSASQCSFAIHPSVIHCRHHDQEPFGVQYLAKDEMWETGIECQPSGSNAGEDVHHMEPAAVQILLHITRATEVSVAARCPALSLCCSPADMFRPLQSVLTGVSRCGDPSSPLGR